MFDTTHAPSPFLPRATPLRRAAAAVRKVVDGLLRNRRNRRAIERLHRLNDHHLKDIGISRDQIDRAVRSGSRWH